MKTADLNALANKINAHLASIPADRRPEGSTRRRIQSVAYASNGYFEAYTSDGNVDYLTTESAAAILENGKPSDAEVRA